MASLEDILNNGTTIVTSADALDFVIQDHEQQLKLCDLLEEIADSLPDRIDEQQCVCAALVLRYRVNAHHRLEENVLFPRMLARAEDDAKLQNVLNRLADEHRTDEGHCDEAIELLTNLSRGGTPANVEAAGYLLRGLFEGLRRHIAFENDHIMPKAHDLLQEEDLALLAEQIKRSLKDHKPSCFTDALD